MCPSTPNSRGPPGGRSAQPCFNCQQPGHRAAECTNEKVERPPMVCYNCNEVGHASRDCPEPRAAGGAADKKCYNCSETGHLSRDCPQAAQS
jgi:cellular nucleic acid-binding protein